MSPPRLNFCKEFAVPSFNGLSSSTCIYVGNLMIIWTLPLLLSPCRGTRTSQYMHSYTCTELVQASWKNKLKEGTAARNHVKDRAGLVAGEEMGDTGCCILLRRDGHSRSSSCFALPSSSQPPALWFSRALGDLSETMFCLHLKLGLLSCKRWSRHVVWSLLSA